MVVVAAGLMAVAGLVVVVAGLVVVVVVDVAGLVANVGAVEAGLDVVGALGAADGVWATATEAIAPRVMIDKVIGLMVRGFC